MESDFYHGQEAVRMLFVSRNSLRLDLFRMFGSTPKVARILCGSVLFALLAAWLPAGCALKSPMRVAVTGAEVPATGPVAADIQNVRGAVELIVEKWLDRPVVEVIPLEGGRPVDTAEHVATSLTHEEYGSILRVVSSDTARGAAPPMLLRVRMPACDGVRIRTSQGGVLAVGIGGAIDIAAVQADHARGIITVRTRREISHPVSIKTDSGDVTVTLGSHSSLRTVAETAEGTAKLLASTARVSMNSQDMHRFDVNINDASSPCEIRTGRGHVRVSFRD